MMYIANMNNANLIAEDRIHIIILNMISNIAITIINRIANKQKNIIPRNVIMAFLLLVQ